MEPSTPSGQGHRIHPLVATAAISVIVLSAVGITAMVMSRSSATPSDAPPPAAAAVAAPVAPVAAPVAAAAPQPEPVRSEPTPAALVASNGDRPSTPDYGQRAPQPQGQPAYNAPVAQATQAAPVCRDCGVVASIRDIKVKGEGTGVGAVGGAVVGGLLGNMVGAGRGKALATVGGAVAGGFGGNAIEKNVRSEVEHQMVVRLDNARSRTFTQASPFPYREGERVRIVNGHVERN